MVRGGLSVFVHYAKAVHELGVRTVVERLRRLGIDLCHTFGCETCGATWPEMSPFMVKDEIWQDVVLDEEAHLCLRCFRDKLGRPLREDDFTNVPLNDAFLCGFAIARGRNLPIRRSR